MPSRRDWIVAPATPAGPSERAVLRLSGPGLLDGAVALLPAGCPLPRGRREARAGRVEWTAGARLPATLLVFPAPGSATGEDVLELHLPGSAPVVSAVLARCLAGGARLAEPGEFTRRAFLNGRLDLTAAEAVLEVVGARSRAGVRAAGAALSGRLGAELQAARDALADALAEIEAGLDFEEGDAADLRPAEIDGLLARARTALRQADRGEAARPAPASGWRIGLTGRPNAGKTSLFARLTGATALVSAEPGTTRDRLEAVWRPPGGDEAWTLADGPGMGGPARDPRDAAARRRATGEEFDLWWLVVDASDPAARCPERPEGAPSLVVWTKSDVARAVGEAEVARAADRGPSVWVSARSGAGLAELAHATGHGLAGAAEAREARAWVGERHRAALRTSLAALERAERLHGTRAPSELLAEELRAALVPLGELVGELTPEDLLDRVFARFCIGK